STPPPPIRCMPMATALTGAHFAHPTAATRARSLESRTAAAEPFTPTAPINKAPNQAAAPRSRGQRTPVLREELLEFLLIGKRPEAGASVPRKQRYWIERTATALDTPLRAS